jgi:DNA-binding beta-propeller fold protein YncE
MKWSRFRTIFGPLLSTATLAAGPALADLGTDVLLFVEAVTPPAIGTAERETSVGITADGAHVYVATELGQALAAYERDAVSGTLTLVDTEFEGVGGVTGLDGPVALAIPPDGGHVYVASFVSGNSPDSRLAVFARDAGTGMLTFVESYASDTTGGLHAPQVMVTSPDSAYLYLSSINNGTIFSRNAGTGSLTVVQSGPPGPNLDCYDLSITADGAHVFCSGSVRARDAGTGTLTSIQSVSGFGARSAFSGDGTRLYSSNVFTRDTGTGLLTLASEQFRLDGQGTAGVSPDGTQIYVLRAPYLEVDARQTATDALVPVQRAFAPFQGGVRSGVASPDGAHFYAAHFGFAGTAGGVAVFERVTPCPAVPQPSCSEPTIPRKSRLLLKDHADDARDILDWRWTAGPAVSAADVGDPVTTSHYALCVYDASVLPQPRLGAVAPAGGECFNTKPNDPVPCWRSTGSSRVRFGYQDTNRITGLTPDGINRLRTEEHLAGRAKLQVSGAGASLDLPPLPLTLPVRAQLRNLDTGACWEATYGTAIRNVPAQFLARSD